MDDTLQSILYGHLDVEIKQPSLYEQYEILRAVVANPSALRRLKIREGELHPWVAQLLERVRRAERAAPDS